jgi:glycerol-3-phosphate O-acyltransferase
MVKKMQSPLFDAPSRRMLAALLMQRAEARFQKLSASNLSELLADTLFTERKRLELGPPDPGLPEEGYEELLEQAAKATRTLEMSALQQSALALVGHYAREIHNPFSPRAYSVATRILPGALTRLLSASSPRRLLTGEFDPQSRIRVDGPLPLLQKLVEKGHTLLFTPTHVSNLDSPLLGYALFAAGLPPAAYGAGFNLFSNPAMSFFMRRLGAYTVDRRKKNALYKDTLKDYSTLLLKTGCHSLFFPGGTRSRSGRIEASVKKGLLGTGLAAWQENLQAGIERDVLVVPVTLSIGVVLEAETLARDALADEGKQRYIISDDEFSDARQVAGFGRRLMQLDCKVHVTFGQPLDIAGNPTDSEGHSLDPHGKAIDRRLLVTNRSGEVVIDEQRDQIYTERLAARLCLAFKENLVLQSTHLSAWAAWTALKSAKKTDIYRLIRLHPEDASVSRAEVEARLEGALARLVFLRKDCPATPALILDEALKLFQNFHKRRALEARQDRIFLSAELAWYYHNRLVGLLGEGL